MIRRYANVRASQLRKNADRWERKPALMTTLAFTVLGLRLWGIKRRFDRDVLLSRLYEEVGRARGAPR